MTEIDVYRRIISRWDAYAIQATKPDGSGRHGYFCQKKELTYKKLLQSIASDRLTIGPYCVDPETQSTKNPVIDIDAHTEAEKATIIPQTRAVYNALNAVEGYHPYIEASSGNIEDGAHVGMIMAPTSARSVIDHITMLFEEAGIDGVEIFPKQAEVQPGKYGNLVKLPWQYNNRTGQRSQIIDPVTFEPMEREAAIQYMMNLPDSVIPETIKEPVKTTEEFEILNKCGLCFKTAFDTCKQLEGENGHYFRLYATRDLIFHDATDGEIHRYFKVQKDYDPDITQGKIDDLRSQDMKPVTCKKILETGFVDVSTCKDCIRKTGTGQDNEANTNEHTLSEIMKMGEKEADNRLKVTFPHGHFINDFTTWMTSITDGYYEYQVTGALWALSTIVRGKIALHLKQEVVRPNLWIEDIGKSTTSRKSTIVNKARNIYEAATDTKLFNDDFSLEGYLETLANQPINSFVRDEAAGLMAKQHKKYNDGYFEAECAIYDGQDYRKTLAGGKNKEPKTFEIRSPYVTKLYATTPDNLARYMQIEDFLSGYGFRFLYAFPKYKNVRKPLEVETKEDIDAWGNVLKNLKELKYTFDSINEQKFDITQEAMDRYNEIIFSFEEQADKINNDMLNSAIGRNEIHILKIAMLIEIGKKDISFTISKESIEIAADMIINYFLPCCMDVINRLQEDIKNNQIERVIINLRRLGGTAPHTKLLHDCKMKAKDFGECVSTMIESETIKAVKEAESKKTYYVLLDQNKNLQNPKNPFNLLVSNIDDKGEILETFNKLDKYNDKSDTIERRCGVEFLKDKETLEILETSGISNSHKSGKCDKCGKTYPLNDLEDGPIGLDLICHSCQDTLKAERKERIKTPTSDNDHDVIIVRSLKDIPTFAGTDGRSYKLNKHDVATIPTVNALALIKRKVAVAIKQGVRS